MLAGFRLCFVNVCETTRTKQSYVVESERQWAESVATGDPSTVERILADDFLGVDPKGILYDKSKMIGDTRNAPQFFVSNRLNGVKVMFYGDTAIALATSHGSDALVSGGALCGPTPGFGEMDAANRSS